MIEAEWLVCRSPSKMLDSFRANRGPATDRKLRLLAVACCHRILPLLVDARSRAAVEVVADLVEGRATEEQRREARRAAEVAYEELHRAAGFDSPLGRAGFAGWSASAEEMPWLLGYTLLDAAYLTAEGATQASAAPALEGAAQADLCRDIFGNPFRPVAFFPEWRTSTAVALAAQVYESHEFDAMPILADALQDAGCDNADVLAHCRGEGPHVRGCWVVDGVLGKE